MSTIDLVTDIAGASPGLRAYQAAPAGTGPWPGVVVLHEIFGADEVMRRQVDRLATAGYLAVMPDLYSAGGAIRCLRATMKSVQSGTGRAYNDIEAARKYLVEHPDCTGKVGVLGFCMGGGFALMVVTRGFDAGSSNYGMLPKDIDGAFNGACPVVGSYGGKDIEVRQGGAKLGAALTKAGVLHDVKEYPSAGHSFMNDAPNGPRLIRPLLKVLGIKPEPAAAADAWLRIEKFFGEHLAGAGSRSDGAPS